MDGLLNEAKPTLYMSTIELRSGYHQVKVVAEDQEKTAFTCPFTILHSYAIWITKCTCNLPKVDRPVPFRIKQSVSTVILDQGWRTNGTRQNILGTPSIKNDLHFILK
ncbi:hypothetical protein TNCV_22421 [Trichonephila clavipes]|nr:hypothetical protein TNCV_22421 [Trichonephila clavipes]